MRPLRFFIALLFGAAVLITFLKLLFFAAMAALVIGGMYLLFRTFQYAAMGRAMSQGRQGYTPHAFQMQYPAQPFGGFQPTSPFGYAPQAAPPARHIQVL